MISLKRYLDQRPDQLRKFCSEAYLAVLEATSAGALRCCPPTGEVLKDELTLAAEPLKQERTERVFRATQQSVLKALRNWGEQSEAYFARKTAEVKELLIELAATAESMGKRDQRYTQQFSDITMNLQEIAQLEDISRIRTSLLRNATELKSCVDRMARESRESIVQLETSLACHRVQLEQAQELAVLDPLTGLYNRREVEARIARKLTGVSPFCIVILDLNNFKRINDQHGTAAGDEVLRQIAHELRMASRTQDILGRWGGDEFVMLLEGNVTSTRVKIQRMRPWLFGNYELDLGGNKLKVMVSGSIGMAEWSPGETMRQVIGRADADLHRDKAVRV